MESRNNPQKRKVCVKLDEKDIYQDNSQQGYSNDNYGYDNGAYGNDAYDSNGYNDYGYDNYGGGYAAPATKRGFLDRVLDFFAKCMAPQNRVKSIIALVAIVAIVVVVICLAGGNGPKAVAENYVRAIIDGDLKTVSKFYPIDFEEYLVDMSYCYDEEEFFEDYSDEFDCDIDSWKDFYNLYQDEWKEEMEDEYDDYKFTTEVTREKDISDRALEDDYEYILDDYEDYDFDRDDIKDAKLITVKMRLEYEDGTERDSYTVCVIKIGGSWYVLDDWFW